MRSREELEELVNEMLLRVGRLDVALSKLDLPPEVRDELLAVRGAVEAILEE